MKKGLFIDFDGTLCAERYWRSLPPEHHKSIQELFFKDDTQMVRDWMRGKYTAEEINGYASERLNIPYQYLWDLFVVDCRTMRVSSSVLEIINSLRQKFIVGLLTGNMDSFVRFTVPSLKLNDYFDFISVSCNEGKHKLDNNGELFLECAAKYDLDIRNCSLVDNDERCCNLFSSHGGMAFKVNSVAETEEVLKSIYSLH